MKIFDRKTNQEILPKIKSRSAGTDRVIECFLNVRGGNITDIIFGSTSRGYIEGEGLPRKIAFVNCCFKYVTFRNLSDCSFINCVFDKCEFYSVSDITMKNCNGNCCSQFYNSNYTTYSISGTCVFENCCGMYFNENIDPNTNITVKNTPELTKLLDGLEEKRRLAEEARLKNLELRKSIKYGWKVVNAPVLVKLSFPDDAELVNLDKDKSRASVAVVESIHVVNDFGAEGVTNRAYSKCRYKVGERVYPDYFDSNPNQDCGHGIHFCLDIDNLKEYGNLTSQQVESIKSQNL